MLYDNISIILNENSDFLNAPLNPNKFLGAFPSKHKGNNSFKCRRFSDKYPWLFQGNFASKPMRLISLKIQWKQWVH